jgi:hypothetical protein
MKNIKDYMHHEWVVDLKSVHDIDIIKEIGINFINENYKEDFIINIQGKIEADNKESLYKMLSDFNMTTIYFNILTSILKEDDFICLMKRNPGWLEFI